MINHPHTIQFVPDMTLYATTKQINTCWRISNLIHSSTSTKYRHPGCAIQSRRTPLPANHSHNDPQPPTPTTTTIIMSCRNFIKLTWARERGLFVVLFARSHPILSRSASTSITPNSTSTIPAAAVVGEWCLWCCITLSDSCNDKSSVNNRVNSFFVALVLRTKYPMDREGQTLPSLPIHGHKDIIECRRPPSLTWCDCCYPWLAL